MALAAGAMLAVIVGNAAFFGDPLRVQISVPERLADSGFTQIAAEQIFVAQVGRIAAVPSLIPMPHADVSSGPSVLSALAKPLKLDTLVASIQSQVGRNLVTVDGVVMADEASPRLDMVMIVNQPSMPPAQFRLSQENGDATSLVMQGAGLAMENIAPYRVALTQFTQALAGDAASFNLAQATATRALAHPWVADLSTQDAMLRNLLAILAVERGDIAGAQAQLDLSDPIPDVWPGARGQIELNRAFLAVATKRPADARRYVDSGRALSRDVTADGFGSVIDTLDGVVTWANGDLAGAERLFRRSISAVPHDEASHTYLAHLLGTKGDPVEAKAELAVAAGARAYDVQLRGLLQENFWVDPVTGELTKRSAE